MAENKDLELSRASLFQTLDKETRGEEYNDRESDSLSHSKLSLDPKVPIKKISISNVDTISNLSSPKMPPSKGDAAAAMTKSISLVNYLQKDGSSESHLSPKLDKMKNSLTIEPPRKLQKSTTSALNTVSV